jgi:cellulose synthase (UDP-forming)
MLLNTAHARFLRDCMVLMICVASVGLNERTVIAQNGTPDPPETTPSSSAIRHETNGYWLYLNRKKTPALIGMVYQPVPPSRHIQNYANNLGELYQALLDDSEGGKGHGRKMATLGVKVIRVYEVPVQNLKDVARVKQIFRWLYKEHQIKVLVGHWAGLHSRIDFRDPLARWLVLYDAMQMVRLYCHEPWVLGWQLGNENNYHVLGGKLGHEINLDLAEYYQFMDAVAGAMHRALADQQCQQFVALGQGDLAPLEAEFIARMANIDAIGVNSYREPQGQEGIEKVINLAATMIPHHPIFFSEFGRPAETFDEEERQATYLVQTSDVIFSFGAGRLGSTGTLPFGNVIAGFVHEATDQNWKRFERGNSEDAYYGVLEKQSASRIQKFIAKQDLFYKVMPLTNSPEDLMKGAWALLEDQKDYGNAVGYAQRVIDLYKGQAKVQQDDLWARGEKREEGDAERYWALDTVGAAHFLITRARYEEYAASISYEQINQIRGGDESQRYLDEARANLQVLVNDYPDAFMADREGNSWRISKLVRPLFPDLVEPYFQVNLKTTAAFILFCLWLITLDVHALKAQLLRRMTRLWNPMPKAEMPLVVQTSYQIINEPVMNRRRRWAFIALVIVQMGFLFYYMGWWFHPVRAEFHTVNRPLFIVLSVIGLFDCAFYLYIWRVLWFMKRPHPVTAKRNHKVAMVTTYVKADTPTLLRETLLAMKDVEYPHETYVLDEEDDDEVKLICEDLGVSHFTRRGNKAYNTSAKVKVSRENKATNQRSNKYQERTKGGNLNAWLTEHGKRFDFVTFLDPDHKPQQDYLDCVLGFFRDPHVGFVQPPQIYNNWNSNWIARGGAEQSYYFYGPIQMGLYGLDNCVVNGSHSTFRVKALQEIDGYAVHDADDVLTCIRLQAKGWRGVYLPKQLAAGLAPETWIDFFQQQRRWARSIIDLTLHHREEFRGLNWRQKLGYLMMFSYYLYGLGFALLLVSPVLSILTNQAPVNAELATFVRYYVPFMLLRYALLIAWGQKFLILPPKRPRLSWFWFRGGLLWAATWPYFVRAFLLAIRKTPVAHRVTTPKGNILHSSSLRLFVTHIVLMFLTASALIYMLTHHSNLQYAEGMTTFLLMSFVFHFGLIFEAARNARRDKIRIHLHYPKAAAIVEESKAVTYSGT